MKFTKMHGLGNDYVFVNCFEQPVTDATSVARAISDRHTGVGSDGLILIYPSATADVRMQIYNADGSRAEMCGNGIRCVAKFAYEHRLTDKTDMVIETDAGLKNVKLHPEENLVTQVTVDMGLPILDPARIPVNLPSERVVDHPITVGNSSYRMTCVSMGNPHAVVFVDDLDDVALEVIGPQFEHAPQFPQRTNVHFVRVDSPSRVTMRTWERGSGITQACGTGACAVCVAGALTQRTDRAITATLPGGDLKLQWADNDHLHMTGPAVEVFTGNWPARSEPRP